MYSCIKLSEKTSLISMMVLTFVFFLAEIITGYITNSMALVADSFHMLSDVLSIIIAFIAVHFSGKTTMKNTYNWARSEILGAMVNAVFLMALCFTIFVSSIQRIVQVEEVDQPLLVLGVGVAGIIVNVIGLVLFGGHAHAHHHHPEELEDDHHHHHDDDDPNGNLNMIKQRPTTSSSLPLSDDDGVITVGHDHHHHGQMNMRAVFLHVLGDALGSVVVIISALIIHFTKGSWRFYMDPAMSLVIVVIISFTTIPLLKRAAMILLQNPPSGINMDALKNKVSNVPDVLGVHELHIWQLSSKCIIATLHVVMRQGTNFTHAAKGLKRIFHDFGIHSTTVQPEFIENHISMVPQNSIQSSDITIDIETNPKSRRLRSLSGTSQEVSILAGDLDVVDESTCLLSCERESCKELVCCLPKDKNARVTTAFENQTFTEIHSDDNVQ